MNFLAHALLAQGRDEWVVGNMIADFKPSPEQLPREILQGVQLHHKVDALADKNEHFQSIRDVLRPEAGLYAGVVADICCDNLLISQWERYCEIGLLEFTSTVYEALNGASEHLPMPWRGSREDWLASYQTREGLERAMLRVKNKVSSKRRFPDLNSTFNHYFERKDSLIQPFTELFDRLCVDLENLKQKFET